MNFKSLQIWEWQQYDEVALDFHPRLTILTGANGSGKTTILNLLARHSGWNSQSLATPTRDSLSKIVTWFTTFFKSEEEHRKIIGMIEYTNDQKADLAVPRQNAAQYSVDIQNQQRVESFFIPSHRPVFRYEALTSIPTQVTNTRQAFDKVAGSHRNRYYGGNTQSSSFFMKEILTAWGIFGLGNDIVEANQVWLKHYQGFEQTLQTALPQELGFKKLMVRNSEVVLECESGDFIIDGASGGISAIIDMVWQIYMYSTDQKDGFTVLIDEIENHLHPTMQRRLLPNLLEIFPSVCFVVSTHSPLIVGSVKDSNVYVLRHNSNHKVFSEKLDLVNKAKTASQILDEVLGVSFTMPIWAEETLRSVVEKYSEKNLAEKGVLNDMRNDLKTVGLDSLIPEATVRLIEKDDKNQ
jgi:predicted ATPase